MHRVLVLAFLLALPFSSNLPDPDLRSFAWFLVRRNPGLLLVINMVVVPVFFVLGLIYSSIRSAVQVMVEGVASSSDS